MPANTDARARSSRRRFLSYAAVAGCGLLAPGRMARATVRPERELRFLNLHTGEQLRRVYWQEGRYLPEALAEIDYLLRDFRTGEIKPIDTRLLDLLTEVNAELGNHEPLHVISGYRSPETNAMLAARSGGVARNSYHLKGMAIDVRLPGCALKRLRAVGVHLQRGGVGYYPKSDFVHLDTGPVRAW